MKWYQTYFFVLKFLVLAQVILTAMDLDIAKSPLFAAVDGLFKLSLGLFLGIYFWLYTPKGIDWEDGIIISIGGFLILTQIHFTPLIKFYETRDKTIAMLFTLKNGKKDS